MENKKSKGISPVIATIIMVAVAIVISIAAAFWLTGLMGSFTTYENIRVSVYANRTGTSYSINVIVTNPGNTIVNVTRFLVEGGWKSGATVNATLPYMVYPGKTITFKINGYSTSDYAPGRTIRVAVITSRGSYEGQVTLP
ncbi:MAG: archaellin/type IV pilin N-terminal domain-containing protein [Candidatus Methanomethylicia archaeon]